MTNKNHETDTIQERWACFRFSIIGPLLSAPPQKGELQQRLKELVQKKWLHPVTKEDISFSYSTIERWYYQALKQHHPVSALGTKRRSDAGQSRLFTQELKQLLEQQYKEHPTWSYQLHQDNLKALVKKSPELGDMVSYHTVRRYMKANNLKKQRKITHKDTHGAKRAQNRLEQLEVRSYEMDHVHALWHLDFHHGSCRLLIKGQWRKPLLLCIMDDRSRMVCHAQWYLDETTETLVHGFTQALLKRGLPRALMSDNGSAMTSDEFTSGLVNLSILHETTLPYSPYQNGKQETFWGQVEGRLLAMLEGEANLSLSLLNEATHAWVELEYHRKVHSELKATPLERYLQGPDLGRTCPSTQALREAFCAQVKRKLRRSDLTFSLMGKRFEVPAAFRHLEELYVRYTSWDLSTAYLIDQHEKKIISMLYPQDKSANASGLRRSLSSAEQNTTQTQNQSGIAPLLRDLMAEFAATGLPPAYLPKELTHE